jgi:single-strand DNA-binding protein
MNDLNTLSIEGFITNNPELKEFGKKRYAAFSIANNRMYKGPNGIEKDVSFFDVEAWDSNIDTVMSFAHTGRGVRIYGRIKQIRYTENRKDKSITRQRVVIIPNQNGLEFYPERKTNTDFNADVENFYMSQEEDV